LKPGTPGSSVTQSAVPSRIQRSSIEDVDTTTPLITLTSTGQFQGNADDELLELDDLLELLLELELEDLDDELLLELELELLDDLDDELEDELLLELEDDRLDEDDELLLELEDLDDELDDELLLELLDDRLDEDDELLLELELEDLDDELLELEDTNRKVTSSTTVIAQLDSELLELLDELRDELLLLLLELELLELATSAGIITNVRSHAVVVPAPPSCHLISIV